MFKVGKVLRNADKETLVNAIVSKNGFHNRIDALSKKVGAIINDWEIKQMISLYQCSETGAKKLVNDLNRGWSVYTYRKGEGACSWRKTGFSAQNVCSEFNGQYGYCMMMETPDIIALLDAIDAEKKAKEKAERDLTAILAGVTSSKKLLEDMPEFKKFVVIDAPTSTQLVPVETINSVRELLKREDAANA